LNVAADEDDIVAVQVNRAPGPLVTSQCAADIAALPLEQIINLSRRQVAALRPAQVAALTPTQVRALLPSHIAVFSAEQLAMLSPARLAALTTAQLRGLSHAQISALDLAQITQALYPRGAELVDERKLSLARRMSYLGIQAVTSRTVPRPRPFSLWSADADSTRVSDYVSWPTLTDRAFTGRHLPPCDEAYAAACLPPEAPFLSTEEHGQVTALFKRGRDAFTASRSSLLFPVFAQWFTDSFLRTATPDRRRNTSNHEIDMCQLYGLEASTARLLRNLDGSGTLKSQQVNGEEYPPALFDARGDIEVEFRQLPHVRDGSFQAMLARFPDRFERQRCYFATGLERGNSTFGYTAMTTLFLREHNRICRELTLEHPGWDDERLFQTARMIVTILEIKIVVEEYVNHIHAPPNDFARPRPFRLDADFAESEDWYRTNHIAIEFDLLYRWHALIPDRVRVDGRNYEPRAFLTNNAPLFEHGLDTVLLAFCAQPAGALTLFNTPEFLLHAEHQAIRMSRDFRLQSFNAYRRQFGLTPIERHEALEADGSVVAALRAMYPDIERLEFLIGLYAEAPKHGRLFGELMTTMVAHDAFTQALTNPLLSRNVFGPAALSPCGMRTIEATRSLDDIWQRNRTSPDAGALSMDFG